MTAVVAATKAFEYAGSALGPMKEDLEDIIYDISPMDTIFMSRVERTKVKSTTHEWLTDTLTAAAQNAKIEGDTFSAVARNVPARLKTYTQISLKNFEVTGTVQAVDNAGMREVMAYHTAKAGKELKRDIELIALSAYHGTAGSSVLARTTAGAQCWMYTDNHIKESTQTTATTAVPASGFASLPVAGSAVAFTSTELNAMLAQAWSCGGETDTILCGSTMYNKISTFTSLATRFRDVGSRQQAQIIGASDVYVSPYGSHNIVLSRWVTSTVVLALDMKTWSIGYLRPFQTIDIAKVGDSERRTILAEWCLIARSPTANTKITNVTS